MGVKLVPVPGWLVVGGWWLVAGGWWLVAGAKGLTGRDKMKGLVLRCGVVLFCKLFFYSVVIDDFTVL